MRRVLGGRRLHLLWVPALAVAFLGLGQVSLEPARPPATVGTLDLPADRAVWASDPIRVDATAVGMSWDSGAGPDRVWVRASEDGDRWGAWTEIHEVDDHGPDHDTGEARGAREASEAVYVGEARWLQFRVEGASSGLEATYVDTTGRNLPVWERILLTLSRIRVGESEQALAAPDQPPIQPRSAWGGEECIASVPDPHTHTIDRVQVLFVHHTLHGGGANAYTADEVPELLYAICSFHVLANGWDDIGYNVLVDRFGTIWEGRAGGAAEPVLGAHTGGFNSYSTGVGFIGDHRWTAPTPSAQEAFLAYASWKLDVHHLDPLAAVTVESRGSSLYDEGVPVTLNTISGHRDVSVTACPGDPTLALLWTWATGLAEDPGPRIYGGWPSHEPIEGFEDTGYRPTSFRFRMTEEMAWTLVVTAPDGGEVHRAEGVGMEADVPWDGTSGGDPLPFGTDYRVRIDAIPTSGNPPPRPVDMSFQLGSFDPPFADDDESPHVDDIEAIFTEGITSGCAPDRFCPHAVLPRWQMAVFLARLHEAVPLPLPDPVDQGFTDIAGLDPDFRAAIDAVAQLGITTGTAEGVFSPHQAVTRWQMALFLTRQVEAAGIVLPDGAGQGFTDVAGYPEPVRVAIDRLAQLGITNGVSPGIYHPEGVVTRQQMASFLIRTLSLIRSQVAP